jgi:hypothetical protein
MPDLAMPRLMSYAKNISIGAIAMQLDLGLPQYPYASVFSSKLIKENSMFQDIRSRRQFLMHQISLCYF